MPARKNRPGKCGHTAHLPKLPEPRTQIMEWLSRVGFCHPGLAYDADYGFRTLWDGHAFEIWRRFPDRRSFMRRDSNGKWAIGRSLVELNQPLYDSPDTAWRRFHQFPLDASESWF